MGSIWPSFTNRLGSYPHTCSSIVFWNKSWSYLEIPIFFASRVCGPQAVTGIFGGASIERIERELSPDIGVESSSFVCCKMMVLLIGEQRYGSAFSKSFCPIAEHEICMVCFFWDSVIKPLLESSWQYLPTRMELNPHCRAASLLEIWLSRIS